MESLWRNVCLKKYDLKYISVNQLSFVASKKSLKSDEKYYIFNISKYKQKDPGLRAGKTARSRLKNRSIPNVESL